MSKVLDYFSTYRKTAQDDKEANHKKSVVEVVQEFIGQNSVDRQREDSLRRNVLVGKSVAATTNPTLSPTLNEPPPQQGDRPPGGTDRSVLTNEKERVRLP